MYLLDTNICIEFLRGRLPLAYQVFKETDPRLIKIPVIVEAELYLGAAKSNSPDKNRDLIERFLLPFDTIPFTSACALKYAQLRAHLEENGLCIGPNDLFIAATALAYEGLLIAGNTREFKRVPGLRLESWYEQEL